jgi:hypothetical protein
MPCYASGIDPGQSVDPTALALVEYDPGRKIVYRLVALHRFPLGTPYTQLPDDLASRVDEQPLRKHTLVAVDATGVGAPVLELFREQLPTVPVYGITITSGTTVTGKHTNPHVPKHDLIATASVILEQRRLQIAANMTETETLVDELLDYRRTTNERGIDSYAAVAGSHDDLVLALSLALWAAERRPAVLPRGRSTSVPRGRIPGVPPPDRFPHRGY